MKYEVRFYDYNNGATSAIDTIGASADYTVEQYIADCAANADDEWNEMLANGEVTLIPIEG